MQPSDRDLQAAWERLERDHPALTRELSRELFIAKATEALRHSEAYRSAVMSQDRMRAAEVAANVLASILGRLLR